MGRITPILRCGFLEKLRNISEFVALIACCRVLIMGAAIGMHGRTPCIAVSMPVKLRFNLVFFVGLAWLQGHSLWAGILSGGFAGALVPPRHPIEEPARLGRTPVLLGRCIPALMQLRNSEKVKASGALTLPLEGATGSKPDGDLAPWP